MIRTIASLAVFIAALLTSTQIVNGKSISCNCDDCTVTSTCAIVEAICNSDDADGTFNGDCDDDTTSFGCAFNCDNIEDTSDLDSGCEGLCSGCADSSISGSCDDDDSNDCFHEDTIITYKGNHYNMKDLIEGKEPECTVPHTPKSRGVVITTDCNKTVRVTDTHLMATPNGFQLAYSLKVGDKLFGDYDNKEVCTVESVSKEKNVQTYFGLNCIHSEVLAAGVRASTFGDFHTLPSWYMYYVGGAVGTDTASTFGDYVAEWYYSI
jgi:hypothetical protein